MSGNPYTQKDLLSAETDHRVKVIHRSAQLPYAGGVGKHVAEGAEASCFTSKPSR